MKSIETLRRQRDFNIEFNNAIEIQRMKIENLRKPNPVDNLVHKKYSENLLASKMRYEDYSRQRREKRQAT
jgi:hypothetical protein